LEKSGGVERLSTDVIEFKETRAGGVKLGSGDGDLSGKADGVEELVGEG
jgi:hypothetical protein